MGEFDKYLKEQDKKVREDESYYFTVHGMKLKIDEAKKEFPKLENMVVFRGIDFQGKEKEQRKQCEQRMVKYTKESQAWFTKWFGKDV